MAKAPAQRIFQGVRTGEIAYVPPDAEEPEIAAEAIVTLQEMGITQTSEHIEISLQSTSTIDLSLLSSEFQADWRLAGLTVEQPGLGLRQVLSVPFYDKGTVSVQLQHLSIDTAQETRELEVCEDYAGGFVFVRDDVIYNASFIKRSEGAPLLAQDSLSCLSLTNSNDVAFVFPFEGTSSPRILWANKAKLAHVSSYFASMVAGGFEESGNSLTEVSKIFGALKQDLANVADAEGAKEARASSIADDSDEEAADTEVDEDEMASVGDKNGEGAICYVVIRDTPYRTYRALFKWLETREICFATLRSADRGTPIRRNMTASPKAVYRLCHQLGIDDLKALALANFESQLYPFNVVHELFSTDCFYYPELRATALGMLENDWAAVKVTGSLDALLDIVNKEDSNNREMMRVAIDMLKRL